MEISILGQYIPFAQEVIDHRTLLTPPNTPHSVVTDSSRLSEHRNDVTTAIRGNIPLPQYELYPPTYDGVLTDTDTNDNTVIPIVNNNPATPTIRFPRGYDVEVFVKGSKVTWTQGGVLRKVLDFSPENETIHQTLFAWFIVNRPAYSKSDVDQDREAAGEEENDSAIFEQKQQSTKSPGADRQGRQQALVVILKETARIYFASGESHSVHLPFEVHKVWPMDLGLLVERRTQPDEDLESNIEGEGLARFYMIMDPFNEFQVVTLYRLPQQIDPSVSLSQEDVPRIRHLSGTVGNIFNTCVFLSHLDTRDRTVVSFDLVLKRHRIWRYASSMPSALPYSRTQPHRSDDSMAMDIDPDADLQMRTDTYLFEIESSIQGASPKSTILSAHALDGSTVICILDHDTEQLLCYQIIADQITIHLWTKPAVSAVAVEATRKQQRDVLILTADGSLQLWTGYGTEVVPCRVDVDGYIQKQKGKGISRKSTASDHLLGSLKAKSTLFKSISRVTEFRDAVEDRVSLILNDGTILRARLDFTVRSSLVQECLDAITFALPVDLLWDFKHRFLQLQFSKESTYSAVPSTDEWGNFATTLLSFCDPSLPKKSSTTSESDWDFLVNSELHRKLQNHPSFREDFSPVMDSSKCPYTDLIMQAQRLAAIHFRGPSTRQSLRLDTFYKYVLVALHLVYEDRSINLATFNEGDLKSLLTLLAHIVRWRTWVDYYTRRDFSKTRITDIPAIEVFMEGAAIPLEKYEYEPPDIYRWISSMVSSPKETAPFPDLASLSLIRDAEQLLVPRTFFPPCEQTRKVVRFFTALMNDPEGDQSAVRALVDEAFTNMQLDQLPFGVSVPLREALWKCRRNPPSDLSSNALSLIGRNDLAELKSDQNPGYYMKPPSPMKNDDTTKRQDIHSLCEDVVQQEGEKELEITGTEITDSEITDLRFGADMRVSETQHMLQSSTVLKIKPKDEPDLNDDDLKASHQETLRRLAQRTLALPVGRAILTFGTVTHIVAQHCPIPPIVLSAKLLPAFGVTELESSYLGGDQALDWPNFHNGVAAGLRFSSNSTGVKSSWITFNKPQVLDCNHAGFLFALGLTGHLRLLVRQQVFHYLSINHEMTAVGLLLGLACAHRGTMNPAITRILSLHVPALLQTQGSELNLTALTQVACVLGIGLLYMETANRRMAEGTLAEIGANAGGVLDPGQGLQECHSVAAGFALGFITLGQGDKPMGLRDMKIVDVLVSYMPGSRDKNHVGKSFLDGGDHRASPYAGIDQTSAGATVALGLMYLKTNNRSIAAKLSVPETQFLLDYVNPYLLMIRVIFQAMVLWGSIVPTRAWIYGHIPDYLKDSKTGGPPNTESGPQSYYSIVAGACFALGLRFAGSGNEAAYGCILQHVDMFLDLGRAPRGGSYEDSITKAMIRTCLDVTTMAASMVVAGSGRIDLMRRLRKLHQRTKGDTSYGSHIAYHMALGLLFLGGGGYTLGTSNRCVAALLCSLYPRLPSDPMDNRSHLQAFRHLWVLAVEPRCLVTRDARTGACCPVPVRVHLKPAYCQSQVQMNLDHKSSVDHQHQQNLRHHQEEVMIRYSRQREEGAQFTGLNVNSTQDLIAPTLISTSSVFDMMTPCLLPELTTIARIEIQGPRYWPITLDLSSDQEDYSRIWRILRARSISVMRHTGHLSYTEDPLGMRGILARPFPKILSSEGQIDQQHSSERAGSRRQKMERMERFKTKKRWTQRDGHDGDSRSVGIGIDIGDSGSLIQQQYQPLWSQQQDLERRSASYGDDFWLTFLQDPQVASFASYLCRVQRVQHSDRAEEREEEEVEDAALARDEAKAIYFTNVLYECLTMDKVEALGVHVWLYDVSNRLETVDELSWRTLWELRILTKYYDTQLKRHLTSDTKMESSALTEFSTGGGGASGRGPGQSGSSSTRNISGSTSSSSRRLADSGTRMAMTTKMMEDDGSETLVKISRVSELFSKISKRVEQAMESEDLDRKEQWSLDRTAKYYFANGSFPLLDKGKNTKTGSSSGVGVSGSAPAFFEMEVPLRRSKTNWFKVWLELNEIPGPDLVRSIKKAMDKSRDIWDVDRPSSSLPAPLSTENEAEEDDQKRQSKPKAMASSSVKSVRSTTTTSERDKRQGRSKLAEQVFSIAFPGISLEVLEYLESGL
ncbi:Anaphase-promoting complex subunit 1 [Mortierella sp. GBA30]|nr:Anaphase-promoting complex subunit 1 [Mortierella sp. GBA30]